MEKETHNDKVGQEQLYDMLVSRELSWQSIIYDLIKTEQLNPWDIDLAVLAKKYIEHIQQLQELEHGTFFISSKVLLAAAILLRIKSEILRNNLISIDELLFEKKKKSQEYDEVVSDLSIVDFAEEEFPDIIPKTPVARERKVTLQELMTALNRAINTEHRRIKKELISKKISRDIGFVMPKQKIDIRQKIKEIYNKIKDFFRKKPDEKLTFTLIAGTERNERIACFLPLLHLDNQKKIFLEQEEPFAEIEIMLKKIEKKELLPEENQDDV